MVSLTGDYKHACTTNIQAPKSHLFITLLLLIVAGIAFAVCGHALEKHGNEALAVQNCLDAKGSLGTWIRSSDQHITKICQTDDNRFGLQVDDKNGNNITAFIYNAHDKVIKLVTVLKYLHNVGYEPLDSSAKLIEITAFGK